LGPDHIARISERLSPEEVEDIGYEVARMDMVDGTVVEAVLEEWLHTLRAAESIAAGGLDTAREIREAQLGADNAVRILNRIRSQISEHAGLERLRKADPQQLANTLRNEHPQTVALVLAHLDQGQTAAILKEVGSTHGR